MTLFDVEKSTTLTEAKPYNEQEWQTGYRSLYDEHEYWIDDVDGQIPPKLHGTLFRNGPGLLDINGQPIHHPFDGDGMVCAIAFSNGRAHFRNRFVKTTEFLTEQQTQTICYRGVFGTEKPGGWLANAFDFRLKNIANTNVIYWGGKLLALWEAAEPHRLAPQTLDTLGKEYLDGVLQSGSAFAAHPRIDPHCEFDGGDRHLVNFSIKPGLSTTITIYELNSQGTVVKQHAHSVPGFAFIHDFVITPHYCIFFQNPVSFNPLPFVLGLRGAGECITFQTNRPTQAIVIPRYGSAPMQIFPVPSGFIFHHANAFESGDDLYVDSICYDKLPTVEAEQDFRQVDFAALAPGQLWRFTLNLKHQTVERQLIESRCCEFPYIHPNRVGRSYRYMFIGAAHEPQGNAPLQAILKLDLETGDRQLWSAAPWGYVGEPVFVPRPDAIAEDDGWVLTLVYNAKRQTSEIVILDGRNLTQEPLAHLHLQHHVPYGLHGSFTPDVFEPEHQPQTA